MTTPRSGCSCAVSAIVEEAARYREASSHFAPLRIQLILVFLPIDKGEVVDVLPRVDCAVSAIVEEAARYREASSHFAPLRIQLILVFLPIDKGEVVDVLPRVDDAANREEFLVVGVEHPIVADKP